jgi:hypothetical protein
MSSMFIAFQTGFFAFLQIHMSDPIIVAIISSVPATIAAIIGVINHNRLGEVSLNLDGRLSQLLAASVDKGRVAERHDISSGVQNSPPLDKEIQNEEKKA